MREDPIVECLKRIMSPARANTSIEIGIVKSASPLVIDVIGMQIDGEDIYKPIGMTFQVNDQLSVYIGQSLIVLGKVTL